MKFNKKLFLVLIPLVLALFILSSCGIIPQSPEGKISGRVLVSPSEMSKDITGWVPIANAVVTIVDADGVTQTATTDENGYYSFIGIAVNLNTIITATVDINGDTLVLKDVIPQTVTADEDYDAGDMTPESTALALLLEAVITSGIDPSDIDINEIKPSDSFLALISQVTSVLEEGGDVTKDPDITDMIEDIINPPVPPSPLPPSPTTKPDTTITIAAIPAVTVPVAGETPVATITETDQYTGIVSWSPDNTTFEYSTVYTATITLTPKTGYTFTGVPANFFTVADATATNPADSGVVTAVFPATGEEPDTTISIAAIPGVNAPVAGETPVTAITETDEYTGTVSWSPADAAFGYSTEYTATITLTPKTGYTFTGVTADFFTVTGATATNDADSGVVTAVFPETEPNVEYTVIYNGNNNTGGTVPIDSNEYAEGTTVTVLGNTGSLEKTGCNFDGWNTAADGTGTDYAPGETFMMGTSDVTLSAKWALIPNYTIILIAGPGGSVNHVSDEYYEATVVEIEATPAIGYQFVNWTISSGDATNVADTSSASTTVTMNENMTLTANFGTPREYFTFDSTSRIITDYNTTGGLDVVIPRMIDGVPVENIGWEAFYNKGLTGITIPDSMTTIGAYAFCSNQLTSVTIPDSVTSIFSWAFTSNQLTSVTIPDSVNIIGYYSFANNQLTSVTIPDNVTIIGGMAFVNNELTSITISNSVITIYEYAFAENSLTSVTIPDSVTTICYKAFYDNALNSVTIGDNVDIDINVDTMGTNPGFKAEYDAGGKLAGTYNYNDTGSVWEKQ